MNKILKTTTVAVVSSILLSSTVYAGDFSVRVDPGLAIPLTSPQKDRFDPGPTISGKVFYGITPSLDVGPSVSVVYLRSVVPGVKYGEATALGLGARFKRSHEQSGPSPWVDFDLQYVRTDALNRFGASIGAGVSVPTSDLRNVWIGPFVRYQGIVQKTKDGYNTDDARILIFGMNVEFGLSVHTQTQYPAPHFNQYYIVPSIPKPVVAAKPRTTVESKLELTEKIQFHFDSAVIEGPALDALKSVVRKVFEANKDCSIRIEGYASAEGTPEHNQVLSEKRASSVLEYLVANGIPRDQLSYTGLGVSNPISSNDTEEGRSANRRVEFIVKIVVEGSK